MSKQKNILNFFKPVEVKRALPSETESTNKKIKLMENDGIFYSSDDKAKEKLMGLIKDYPILDTKIGTSWFFALENEFSKPYFKKLSEFVESERSKFTVYPTPENVWTWTRMCSTSQVKVVILGQDPYHNPHQAHGLCFSVPKGVAIPPSLINIYKELKDDIEGFQTPSHGDLTGWAKQGVLLLNSSLTVRAHSPNSHADKGWENITSAVIKHISDRNSGVVFLLWGSFAQKKAACVDKKKHHLLKAVHPSPLSVHKGFFGCKHFSACNRLLKESGKEPIDWNKL
ncbi:hypothetical protein RUM44_001000 [Polyplax serrata]|uniref:Uracil-DNA glycosylase n=1 Tax=Polyplax serrata TaxID=468196 RepID=A0ABR1B971_POLSC